jgi:dTDP-4-dehydrorhamnose 3,5-epimerase
MSSSPTESSPRSRIQGVQIVPLRRFADDRGYFFESYRRAWIPGVRDMVQGNVSFSKAGVLRGLHYHFKQADFWLVPSGRVLAGLYDLRRSSPTRGEKETLEMGEERPLGLYIPKGVAHGFRALADSFMTYLVDEYYDNSDEQGVRWDDPALGIDWGAGSPIVSERDRKNPSLADIPEASLPA